MTLIVAKPFNTNLQRFRLNDEAAEDTNFAPHSLGDLKMRKFLVSDEKKPAKAN
ncbi:hypothetical protein [Shinella kummerowiae]|uniref:hypothetical protein n=1 Tax=Shinella kummerowiae TaxID=417745 RepID=UPI0021B6ADB5|nr:hypothetical protein [Shinella kummerowiae]MCT7665668.1 hypothetical protein [Shinella kummerowiae]